MSCSMAEGSGLAVPMVRLRFVGELSRLVRRADANGVVRYKLRRRASIKDVAEALGVPHTEIYGIEEIRTVEGEGQNRDFSLVLDPESPPHEVRLFPAASTTACPVCFNSVDVNPVAVNAVDVTIPTLLRPQALSAVRFLADENVGRLGRLLRTLGLDCATALLGADSAGDGAASKETEEMAGEGAANAKSAQVNPVKAKMAFGRGADHVCDVVEVGEVVEVGGIGEAGEVGGAGERLVAGAGKQEPCDDRHSLALDAVQHVPERKDDSVSTKSHAGANQTGRPARRSVDKVRVAENMDRAIAQRGSREQRIVLSADRGLLKRSEVTHGMLVLDHDPYDQLQAVLRRFAVPRPFTPFSRCLNCNVPLREVEKQQIVHLLQPKTIRYYNEFSVCDRCGAVFWKGSHHDNILNRLTAIGLLDTPK